MGPCSARVLTVAAVIANEPDSGMSVVYEGREDEFNYHKLKMPPVPGSHALMKLYLELSKDNQDSVMSSISLLEQMVSCMTTRDPDKYSVVTLEGFQNVSVIFSI